MDDASIAPYEFHFITHLFVSPPKKKDKRMQRCIFPLHLCILIFYDFISMAIPHNSKCRYGERGAADAKPKAQIILDVLSSILATQMPCRSRRSGA